LWDFDAQRASFFEPEERRILLKRECPSPLRLYELSVQSPKWQVEYLPKFHRHWFGKSPLRFREDFCGSGLIACEWIKHSEKHEAVGIDLSAECIRYANDVNRSSLTSTQQSRIEFRKQDVLRARGGAFDWIGAFNYSYFVFHERQLLLKYLRNAYHSLGAQGSLFLEIVGGPGFIQPDETKKVFRAPGFGKVTQIWEQHGLDPITQVADYAIHFQLPDGSWIADAFVYHWRIWSPREIRELLAEAGFQETFVLLEKTNSRGVGTGVLEVREESELTPTWVGYIVGLKKLSS
jgi:SAM-dependent methyltransferase